MRATLSVSLTTWDSWPKAISQQLHHGMRQCLSPHSCPREAAKAPGPHLVQEVSSENRRVASCLPSHHGRRAKAEDPQEMAMTRRKLWFRGSRNSSGRVLTQSRLGGRSLTIIMGESMTR